MRFLGESRGIGNPNAFETLLSIEGTIQRNGKCYKPNSQGEDRTCLANLEVLPQPSTSSHGHDAFATAP